MTSTQKIDALALYSERKATEVAAFFLLHARERDMSVTKLRLAKWMYLAERRAYETYAEPITGDRMISMEHGPVLSNTLYLIENPRRAEKRNGTWENNISMDSRTSHKYMSMSDQAPYKTTDDLRSLSEAEVEILEDTWNKYSRLSSKELETLLHDPDKFPEWNWEPRKGNPPIELERLLPILGYDSEEAGEIVQRLDELKSIEQAFSRTD